MSPRHHSVLRIAAVVVLAAVALWPSSRAPAHAAPRSTVRAAETAQAKRAERPRASKVIVADADTMHASY